MMTTLPIFTAQPLLPPFGLLMLLSWRLMRPGLLPVWSGVPFGLMDDVFSGQPFGSAALLWSLAMLIIEIIDSRAIWRDHIQDWLIASLLIIAALLGGLWIAGLAHAAPSPIVLLPQIALSILLYPLVVRICARLDSWRLAT
jgi:rod shape-determining protein MreD